MTELAAPQISSLMEALPGIAAVLRSPVANAIVALSRAGAGLEDFRTAEAEELLRYGVRRNLLTQDEIDRVMAEIREAVSHRPAKAGAAPPEKAKKVAVAAPAAEHRPVAKAPMVAPVKVAAPAKAKAATPPKAAAKPAAKPVVKAKHPEKKAAVAAKSAPAAKKGSAKPAAKKPAAKKGHR